MNHSEASLHILLVEDDPDQVQFLRTTLRIGGDSPYELTHAGTLAEGMAQLDRFTPDIILLDLHLPDSEDSTPRGACWSGRRTSRWSSSAATPM